MRSGGGAVLKKGEVRERNEQRTEERAGGCSGAVARWSRLVTSDRTASEAEPSEQEFFMNVFASGGGRPSAAREPTPPQ